jgi:Mg-chelatase subunit ChlI
VWQRCYRGVTEVLQRCYRGVTEVYLLLRIPTHSPLHQQERREERGESREQRAESREQKVESREQRAESREQRAEKQEAYLLLRISALSPLHQHHDNSR